MNKQISFFILLLISFYTQAQIKILFDATKAETASNADWVIDSDQFNLGYNPNPYIGGREANPQRFPSPDQSTVNANTTEDYWTGANSAWGIELVQYGYQVETLPYDGAITYGDTGNPQDLSHYDVFIVTEPNILFTANEKTAILEFVANGGGLFMTSDHDRSDRNGDGVDSIDVWNDLIVKVVNGEIFHFFGLLFDDENFSQTSDNKTNNLNDPSLNGPFGQANAIEFHGGTSMTLYPYDNSSVTGVFFKTGANNTGTSEVLFAHATYGQGRIAAIGDSSPADDGTGDTHDRLYNGWFAEANGSHRIMMMNTTIWLAEGNTNNINQTVQNKIRVFIKNGFIHIFAPELSLQNAVIYNISGQQIQSFDLKNNNQIAVNHLPKGLYFLITKDQKNRQYSSKFIVK